MLIFFIFKIYLLNVFKCEKIELEDFKLESNQLYSLAKFTYINKFLFHLIRYIFINKKH